MNHQISYLLQDIFNLLPDVTNPQFVKSINVNTNDQMLVVYTASLIRSIIALHNLINNKLTNKEAEKREGGKKDDSKDKDKDKDEDKDKEEEDEDTIYMHIRNVLNSNALARTGHLMAQNELL